MTTATLPDRDALLERTRELKTQRASDVPVVIRVAMGTCGIAANTTPVLEALRREVEAQSRADDIAVLQTGCMGLCHSEPSIEVYDRQTGQSIFYGNVTPEQAPSIVKEGSSQAVGMHVLPRTWYRPEEEAPMEGALQARIVLRNSGRIDPESIDDYLATDGYTALADALAHRTPEDVIQTVTDAGLRGRGGGGFPTGVKWSFAARQPAGEKFVVCNADEGDPGAFMDRAVLEGDPHAVLEAMAIAGYAIGAGRGIVYIRAEYPLAVRRLETAMTQAHAHGLLGKDILGSGFDFDIDIKYGAGAFVCGEETALLHSIEGLRGEPIFKPPYPAVEGLWKRPTIVNNVETLANVPAILRRGADWFRAIGTEKSPGTKVFALAGKVNRVGLVEVPMGTTLREIVFGVGEGIKNGRAFKAVQTGGPSGGCLRDADLDTPIDYDTLRALGSMMGSGGMIVMDEDDCMVNIAKFFLEFTLDESCGRCTPCRVGNKRLHEMLVQICDGRGTMQTLEKLRQLSEVIKDTSLCGLGQTSPNPVLSTLRQFRREYMEHVLTSTCAAGVCSALVRYSINENCVGCTMCARRCPVSCIAGEPKQRHVIDQDRCIKCGVCLQTCTFHAVDKN